MQFNVTELFSIGDSCTNGATAEETMMVPGVIR